MAKRPASHPRAKRIIIIAGPNGAGKTTFASEFLHREGEILPFMNADHIGQAISPFHPERAAFQAGRIMLGLIKSAVKRGDSFAFETTLSGLLYARQIPQWRSAGYHIKLIFLSLPSVEIALWRIKNRVASGGHDVPDGVVRRRFDAGLANFHNLYQSLVDSWILYDNADALPIVLASGENK